MGLYFQIKETAMRLTPMGLIQVKMTPVGLHPMVLYVCIIVSFYYCDPSYRLSISRSGG